MATRLRTVVLLALLSLCAAAPVRAQEKEFKPAPAVAVEAEDFTVEAGWKVIANGRGNYMVDIIGFQHISGERLLGTDEKDKTASAFADVTIPVAGTYRLWVRYEYPPFCDTRFKVLVQQGGVPRAEQVMGVKDNPRYAFGEIKARPQYDPPWGPEGLVEEAVTVPGLQAGPARVYLKAVEQPQVPGVTARRHVDLVYLTSDAADAWQPAYHKRNNLYPILDAFRDAVPPRYEVRFTNRGGKPASFQANHTYNRLPWYVNEGIVAKDVPPGAASPWVGLKLQDTCHFHMVTFTAAGNEPFDVELRPRGGAVERAARGEKVYRFYLPTYPGKGEKIVTPVEQIDAILKHLKETKPIGKAPTLPLCYGGWMPLGDDSEYGRKYAQLYAAIGMRSLHPANSGPKTLENLQAAGVPLTKSWMVMSYRNPPTPENIANAQNQLAKSGLADKLLWYDYGDEIHFSEWLGMMLAPEVAKAKAAGKAVTPADLLARRWQQWIKTKRPWMAASSYWLPAWGAFDPARLKPDSSAAAAAANRYLYVDSLIFYEETAIGYVADGAKAVKAALGPHVLCGANYSAHPFYYPPSNMYVKWFRGGAADLGRHSEYFWQVGQPGPMINGYIAEHFRAGMKHNPKAVLRQYTMPHLPGNTDANFLRSAFSHLAHGATMLDFFGIGLNESFTENYVDHRGAHRYRAVRDVTHAVGLVEDLLPEAKAVPSPAALLVSDSTERWDFAGIATDLAGHAHFGPDFRKTRLCFHLERLGLWKALTFSGASPDLLIEEDLNTKALAGYKLLVVVGDCLPPEAVPALTEWVKAGGTLLATGRAGAFDPYLQENKAMLGLLGLEARTGKVETPFFRPRQELPFLKPTGILSGKDGDFGRFAISEELRPAKGTEVLATLKGSDKPAATLRALGKGRVYYVAALPGVAYLYTALQTRLVPDRGPNTHSIPEAFDVGAAHFLDKVVTAARVDSPLTTSPEGIDARLLKAPKGYVLPLANYHDKVGQEVVLSLRLDGKLGRVTSAYHGVLPARQENGRWVVTIPRLGYGDVLRLDP